MGTCSGFSLPIGSPFLVTPPESTVRAFYSAEIFTRSRNGRAYAAKLIRMNSAP